MPTSSPTVSPTFSPSLSPTYAHKIYRATLDPTTAPTSTPVQVYNDGDNRLEFYVFYNDTNGINVIFGKWMKEELLKTYDEITGISQSSDEVTAWRMGGILNLTFCVVFNEYYHGNSEDSQYCQRFKEYGFDKNMENIHRRRLQQSHLNVQ